MTQVAWSYSVLNSAENCAWRHYLTKVTKEVTEQQNDQMLYGNRVHKALEERLKNRVPLSDTMQVYEPIVARVEQSCLGGQLMVETQMALDVNYQKTKWFGRGPNSPWVRAIVDFGVIKGSKALLGDWKTGRRDPDSAQLRLSAAVTFAHYPAVQTIYNSFVWLKTGEIDAEVFKREDVPGIWQEFLPRVRRLELMHESGNWPKKPSGLCRKHCPVPRAKCEYSGG